MVLHADLGELFRRGPEPFHVFLAGGAEHVGGRRHRELLKFGEREEVAHHRLFPVVVRGPERTGLHLLEAQRECAVHLPAPDRLRGEEERGRPPRRTVVVDVHDGNAGEAEFVDGPLSRRRLAVHVSDVRLLHEPVLDPGVLECPATGLTRHAGVVHSRAPGFSNFVIPTPTTNTLLPIAAP